VATTLADGLASAAGLQEQWRFAAARELLVGVLAQATEASDRLAVVTGRRMFAEVLRDLGEVDEAHAVAAPLVDDCEDRFGRNHPATARARTVLATTLHARGDLDAAEEAYGSVLDGRFRESGPAGRAVRLARAYLALLHRDRGDATRARAELEDAHRALRRAYGITDSDTIRFGTELGRMHREAGDLPAARRVLAVARAGCQATLDPWHPLCVFVERELTAVEPQLPRPTQSTESMTREEWASRVRGPAPPEPAPMAATTRPAPPRRAKRTRRLALLVGSAVVLAGVVVAVVVLLTNGAGTRRTPGNPPLFTAPAATGSPRAPLRVQLRDDATSILVTWDDPADGPAPVVIAVSRDGQPATVAATVPAGTTRYRLDGLDAKAGYCVIAAAAYADQPSSNATEVCTQR
jgi:hypothetical protein